jgi:GTP diphosphokinase / guanosine-3',5'-bis(diphosphate) 3'-diphosphatase
MHRIAEEGIAAHWKYKEGKLGMAEGEEQLGWLRQLIESQSEISDPREFLSNLKIDLYADEVYCFTPKGEIIFLPRDATPVDFAYAIHTAIGHRCVAAKVNSRIVPLRHKLKNGEIVEVITAQDASPSRDWLSFVKTTRAGVKIKHWINQKEKEAAAELGRKLIEREARRFKTTWKMALHAPALADILAQYGLQTASDIYPAVGFGKIAPRQILSALFPDLTPLFEENAKQSAITSAVRRILGRADPTITVKGQDGLLVFRAKCCNPIRGDEIIGYITRGKGISVHTTSCPRLANFLGSDRMTDVEWIDVQKDEVFGVRLAISVEDRRGILADITSAISKLKTNIRESRSTSDLESGRGTVEITVDISDVKHLQKVIHELKSIRGIQEVERVSRIP